MSAVLAEVARTRRGVFGKELGDDQAAAVEEAARRGLAGCFLGTPGTIDPGVARLAAELGVSLGVSLGSLNPTRPERSVDALAAGDGDLLTGLQAMIIAADRLDPVALMIVVGTEEDRFSPVVRWSTQLDLLAELLVTAAPTLRATGRRLLVKTHQETTSWEAARLVDRVGADVLGVAFDPVNTIVRMEDPLAAAGRLAGVIGQVHVDDTRLVADDTGLHRQLVPAGEGVIDWPALVTAIGASDPEAWWWGEIHRAELSMPFTAASWFDHHPDIEVAEVAGWLDAGVRTPRSPGPLVGDLPARIDAVLGALEGR